MGLSCSGVSWGHVPGLRQTKESLLPEVASLSLLSETWPCHPGSPRSIPPDVWEVEGGLVNASEHRVLTTMPATSQGSSLRRSGHAGLLTQDLLYSLGALRWSLVSLRQMPEVR